jgi:hypothetical protein
MISVVKYFAALMCVVYILLGVALIWGPEEVFPVHSKYAVPMGSILIAYGVFRGYRVYQKYFIKS